jgi:hypothetical protein
MKKIGKNRKVKQTKRKPSKAGNKALTKRKIKSVKHATKTKTGRRTARKDV